MAKIKVLWNAADHHYHCDGDSTLLEQALAAGISLPFSCMSGNCTTCKARLLAGEVAMEDSSSLDQEELDGGHILTCQAYPRSDEIQIEVP